VGLNSLKYLNLTNVYPNNNNNNNKVKSKPLELFELAGKKFVADRARAGIEHGSCTYKKVF
jgi:hypothetical protein